MGTYQKTKVIQSYLRIWGSCDPIESDTSEPNPTHGCYVIESDFMHDLVKFGHFCGGIVTKIGIGAKKGKNCILLWVQRYKKKLCQPSDPEVLRRLLNEVEEGKFTLKK